MSNVINIFKNLSKRKLLILLFSALMLINAAFVYIYFPAKFKEQALEQSIEKANAIAEMVGINVGSAIYFEDMESAEQAIRSFKGVRDLVNVIVFSKDYQPTLIVNLDSNVVFKIKVELFKLSGFSEDMRLYTSVKRIYFNRKWIGHISVCISVEDINKKVAESRRIIAAISIGMVILGLIGVILISLVFIKPLNNLVNTFLKISKGDLSSRVRIDSKDEFGKLGEYFNSMVDKVETTQRKLFDMNIGLEQKVEERTVELKNEIEERKKTEIILRESEERIRNIFENAPFGIYQTSLEGKVLFANPALVKMLKYDSMESLLKIDVSKQGFVLSSDRIDFHDKLIKETRVYDYHARWIAQDGSVIHISENARLVKDEYGKIMYIEGMVEDISERMKAEEKLRENEEKYRNIFEQFQDVYFKVDIKGQIVELSPSAFTFSGYSINELLGQHVDIVFKDKLNKLNILKLLLTNKKISNFESAIVNKSGDMLNVNLNAQLEYDSSGNPKFITGTLHDISYLKRIENQLKDLNATKDKFFSIIAHDLRNPISSFIQGTDLLINDYEVLDEEERNEIVHSLHQTSKSLLALLENLLTWSRAQTGKISYTPEVTDVYPIIMNNISLLEFQAANKEIKLISLSNENTLGYFDINMINTILRNLISNAIKFTKPGGQITIGSKIEKNELAVWVQDTGVGMSNETASSLFNIGSVKTTRGTADEKGTGLGLVLCKELVEKNNGKICVESKIDKGTRFTFRLPTKKENNNFKHLNNK